jgi:YidC/Oxa1 family membrane protein insertase
LALQRNPWAAITEWNVYLPEYRSPQQEESGGQSRMLLVLVVAFALILVGQFVFFKNKPITAPAGQAAQTAKSPAVDTSAASTAAPETPPARSSVPVKAATSEVETVVENDLYRIVFTNHGAQAKSWVLKKYKDDKGQPLDLVNPASANFGLPLGLYTYDEALRSKINSALYVATPTGNLSAPGEVTFEYSDGAVSVRKTFHFDTTYVVWMETAATVNGKPIQAFPMWPAGFGDQASAPSFAAARIDYFAGDKVERLAAKKISGGNTLRGPLQWAGAQDQYFAAIFLPDNPAQAAMVTFRNEIQVPKDPAKPDPNSFNKVELLGAAVGGVDGVTRQRLFVGPKALNILDQIHSNQLNGQAGGPDLGHVVDFGFFGLIARPLFLWLLWTHEHMASNWGVSIIILTVIINLALLPLRITSMKSALKMQKLQPQMKAIQERYKKYPLRDPRRADMNAEISELYKKEGANPAGGCLPLVIQMPFLFAFYSMLGVALELRQAPFMWLHDLSSPDKLFILPVLIVISTLFVQKMTPNAGMDPAQQRMMTIMMPLMLGFFSWSLASGLSLYWVVGNIIAIAQQYVMNRTGLGKEMRAEMEKRARKAAK